MTGPRGALGDLPRLRIGADIGGTFTDVAAVDADGVLRVGKQLTTHGAEGDGVVASIAETGVSLAGGRTIIAHGHTLVINLLLERRGARVALVTTEGFGDVVEMARGSRPETFNLAYRRDATLIARELRFEVRERVFSSGEIAQRPSSAELVELVDRLRAAKVEAVAVAFLNSYVEPANELLVAEHLRAHLDGVPVTASCELSRQWREFERFTTAAANAYVTPMARRYVGSLLGALRERAFDGELVILDSSGGALSTEAAGRFPVRTVESGPVAGVIGARDLARELSIDQVVTLDMGGTTAKSCLVEGGRFAATDLYWIGGYERGFPLQADSVDVTEIGAGGGSIAWIDDAGGLRLGPRSAGSSPGPACYGLGGVEPTVTDANLVCGRLDPDRLVGSLTLDPDAARRAIEGLARRARLAPRRLALGVLELANLSMAAAVRRQTLERGRDPREFTLVAFGGAGPMHACEVAMEVGIHKVVVPRFPGHFSAIGMLGANRRMDRRESLTVALRSLDGAALRETLARIAGELEADLSGGGGLGRTTCSYALGLRYGGQDHNLLIPSPAGGLSVPKRLDDAFRTAFEAEYVRRYGHLDEQAEIEVAEVQVVAERSIPRIAIQRREEMVGEPSEITSYFGAGGDALATAVLPRAALAEGAAFRGPAIIYEDGATTVVPPRARGSVAVGGHLVIEVGRGSSA